MALSSHLATLSIRHEGITHCKKLESMFGAVTYGITSIPNFMNFRPAIL